MAQKLVMFPGQGSQYPGMAKGWVENFAEARQAFEEASDGAKLDLKKLVFDGSDADLKSTEITQPAILTATVAVWRSLRHFGDVEALKKNSLFAGHSLGEFSALVCAGSIPLGPAALIVHHRGRYMQEAVPAGTGGMTALVFKPGVDGSLQAAAICEEASKKSGKSVAVANFNSPEQVVVSGHMPALAALAEIAKDERFGVRRALPLPVSAPFHSVLMKPAAERLAPELRSAPWAKVPGLRYIANVTASDHDLDAGVKDLAERFVAQITGSVRWVESVQRAIALGATEAIEVGPGAVLCGLVKRISKDGVQLAARNIDKFEEFKNAPQL
jgi:[acyl-carrier-protein] S-malonyltransferase